MREYIAYTFTKSKELMMETNEKMKISLSTYPDDEEIRILLQERNTFYKELYDFREEDSFVDDTIECDEDNGDTVGKTEANGDVDEEKANEDSDGNDKHEKYSDGFDNTEEDDTGKQDNIEGVYNIKDISKEVIFIPSRFYNSTTIFEEKKIVQKTTWEENKNLAIVEYDDPFQYLSQGSSYYCSSQELIRSDEGETKDKSI
jgi:hypothetical protein